VPRPSDSSVHFLLTSRGRGAISRRRKKGSDVRARDHLYGRPSAGDLTQRQVEVLQLLSTGLTNREIAARLFISEAGVKFHLASLFRHFGVDNRLALVLRVMYTREDPDPERPLHPLSPSRVTHAEVRPTLARSSLAPPGRR